MGEERPISEAEARYLDAIERLGQGAELVSVRDLAEALGLRPASVSEMLDRLAAAGLVRRTHRGAALLTTPGREQAGRQAQRRAVVERFLREVLEVPGGALAEETARLSPLVSPELEARMAAALRTRN